MKKIKLGTPEHEMRKCIAAFKRQPECKFAWCCHHTDRLEEVAGLEGAIERIEYINKYKDYGEQAVRFHNFRPVSKELTRMIEQADSKLNAVSRKQESFLKRGERFEFAIEKKIESYAKRMRQKVENMKVRMEEQRQDLEQEREDQYNLRERRHVYRDIAKFHKKDVPKNTWGKNWVRNASIFGPGSGMPNCD